MFSKKVKSPLHCRLLVTVIHDDLESFHFPGEVAILNGIMDGRVCISIGNDTLLVDSHEIEPVEEKCAGYVLYKSSLISCQIGHSTFLF